MRKLLFAFVITLGAAGCGSSGGNTDSGVADLAKVKPPDMAIVLSSCGKPGDTGNSIGVGKFCTSIADCTAGNMKTTICSALGNGVNPSEDDTYFCTIYPCDPSKNECGEDATCVCGGAGGMTGCGCTPNSCLGGGDTDGGSHD